MGKQTAALLKLAGVTAAIFLLISVSISTRTGFHIHDTYVVMNVMTKLVLLLVCSAFAGSLVVCVFSRFSNRLYVRILLFSFLLLLSAGMYIFSVLAGRQ